MVHFPAEILRQVLLEIDGLDLRLVLVNKHWRDAVESIYYKNAFMRLDRCYSKTTPTCRLRWQFDRRLSEVPRRRQFVKRLDIIVDYYFPDPFPRQQYSSSEDSSGDTSADDEEESDESSEQSEEDGNGSNDGSEKSTDDGQACNNGSGESTEGSEKSTKGSEEFIVWSEMSTGGGEGPIDRSQESNEGREEFIDGGEESNEDVSHDINATSPSEDDGSEEWKVSEWSGLNSSGIVTGEEPEGTPSVRFQLFQRGHCRLFDALKVVWDELASWGSECVVYEIYIVINGCNHYTLLGDAFQDDTMVQKYFSDDKWLAPSCLDQLPSLPSVTTLHVIRDWKGTVDLWPQIVACQIARTLPCLESLELRKGNDYESNWHALRVYFRGLLGRETVRLPPSLRTIDLKLRFEHSLDHTVTPRNFLLNNRDTFSIALHQMSINLSSLTIVASSLSSSLFSGHEEASWPNLRVLDITTNFETADGGYWMLPSSSTAHLAPETQCVAHRDRSGEYFSSLAYSKLFRIQPDPKRFDDLSINIARAASRMPRLNYMKFKFEAPYKSAREHDYQDRRFYENWAFYFHAKNEVNPKSKFFTNIPCQHQSPDHTSSARARTEWVFQIPYADLGWQEPREAQDLWKRKLYDVDFDVVTQGTRVEPLIPRWERWRGGKRVALVQRSYRPRWPHLEL